MTREIGNHVNKYIIYKNKNLGKFNGQLGMGENSMTCHR